MKRTSIGTRFLAIALGAGLAAGLLAQAWAQYPPPGGNVVLTATDTSAVLGEEVGVTATVQDANGVPATGVECTFSVAEQPGNDATVDPGPFTTDAAGNVSSTLDTGSAAGTIVVEVACGELSAQVSVVAGAAAPPASFPETGSGSEGDGMVWASWTLLALGALVGLGGVTLAWRRIRG